MTRTIPLAQDSGLPLRSGEGRFRASTPASLRHSASYSAFRCSRKNASIRPRVASYGGRTAAETGGSSLGCRLVWAMRSLLNLLAHQSLDLTFFVARVGVVPGDSSA